MATVRGCFPAATLATTLLLLSCSSGPAPTRVEFSGDWSGHSSGGSLSSPCYLTLAQNGTALSGRLDGFPLTGAVEGSSVTFSFDSGGCIHGEGSGTVAATSPDRDRMTLTWVETGCDNFSTVRTGLVERVRCAGGMACSDWDDGIPFCVDFQTDVAHCGHCDGICEAFQECRSGTCVLPACTGPAPLQTPVQFESGNSGPVLTLGDLDRDGVLDAVVGGGPDLPRGQIAVLLGDGLGGFRAPRVVPVPAAPTGLALGDLNRDGVLDIVVYASATPGIQVLRGVGDGSFSPGESYPTGRGALAAPAHAVLLADLDRDGLLDVVTPSDAPGIEVRRGRGDGSFEPPISTVLAGPVWALSTADLDGDGTLDVVAVGHDPVPFVSVLLGRGDLTFQAPVGLEGPELPFDATVADVDRDGIPDLVIAGLASDFSSPRLIVHFGLGGGSFGPPLALDAQVWDMAISVVVVDANHDGHLDVVATSGGGLRIIPGHGDRTFGPTVLDPITGGTQSVLAADLDGDGLPELIAAGPSSVSVLRSCGR
jgi:FG-GAP-like repeat